MTEPSQRPNPKDFVALLQHDRKVFVIHALLAAAALLLGHTWGALGILLPGVVIHLYPALLQRSIMLRVQPLLERYRGG